MAFWGLFVTFLYVNSLKADDSLPKLLQGWGIPIGLSQAVIGGTDAEEGKYPYQVSIRASGTHKCGGAVLSSEWIVTSASCLGRNSAEHLSVTGGSVQLQGNGAEYSVRKVIPHNQYSSLSLYNDIALLNVDTIELNEKLNKISIKNSFVGNSPTPLTFTGWGSIRPGGKPFDVLQVITLESIPISTCKSSLPLRYIDNSKICTSSKPGQGLCNGDYGGPLVQDQEDGSKALIGIASRGDSCWYGNVDAFERAFWHVSWINQNCDNCLSK